MVERRARPDARHAFEDVDDQPRPAAWVQCLDTLHAEPFYREYKARVRTLLAPAAGACTWSSGPASAPTRSHSAPT
jgi:hypothetical protein